jgi:hypothetical protein
MTNDKKDELALRLPLFTDCLKSSLRLEYSRKKRLPFEVWISFVIYDLAFVI